MQSKQVIVTPRQTNIVRKAEALINARYSLSTLAIKIITSVIAMIDKKDEDFKLYVLKVTDFKELLDADGKLGGTQYKTFKDACNELASKKIEFDEGEDEGFFITRWIASAEYFAGSGEVEIEISQKLRPLLLQLKEGNYLNYELKNILSLRSAYLIKLYEKLKHEYNKVARYKGHTTATYEVFIEELRKDFKIPSSYQYSSHIKKLILDKAVEQFKEHTDIDITWKPARKRGKKVLSVEFTIRENTAIEPHLKSLRAFISYMRKHKVNQDIWVQPNDDMILSISQDGKIYNKRNLKFYSKKESQVVWEQWFELAKKDNLEVIK